MGTVYAASEKDLAVSLVDKAAALAQTQGKEKALAEISTAKGQFDKGETKKVELKTTYLKKVGDLIICCGIYK